MRAARHIVISLARTVKDLTYQDIDEHTDGPLTLDGSLEALFFVSPQLANKVGRYVLAIAVGIMAYID